MSRMRVIQVNLHLTEEGCLLAVQEVGWKGHHKRLNLLQRRYVEGVGYDASPHEVFKAVAELFALQDAPRLETDPS